MSFRLAVSTCLSKYASFKGRARRSELWWFYLFVFIVAIVALSLDTALDIQFFYPLTVLSLLLPIWAAGARRLHDIGRSGWWQVTAIVPLVGLLLLVFWWTRDSEPGANRYGESPKGGETPEYGQYGQYGHLNRGSYGERSGDEGMTTIPPNWYADPERAGMLRYWDGARWTDDRMPLPPVPLPQQEQQ